ncbi:MAG: GEVED domain-containing protein [Bacteroidia bacterium]
MKNATLTRFNLPFGGNVQQAGRRFGLLFLFVLMWAQVAQAQITISTAAGVNYTGANGVTGNSAVTFVIENTDAIDYILTDVSVFWQTANNNATVELWRSTTDLSGLPSIEAPAWTSVGTGGPIAVPTNDYYPSFTNLTVIIPANSVTRYAVQSSTGVRYSGPSPAPAPSTFSVGGLSLHSGDYLINGLNIGYGGSFTNPSNNPRWFTGSITVIPAVACTAPPVAGTTVASVTELCPGASSVLNLSGASFGTGQTYQWQTSSDNVNWTNIVGETNISTTVTPAASSWYRCEVICSGQSSFSSSQLVTVLGPAYSGTITVNPALPVSATNFTDLAQALNAVGCVGVSGPVTINVAPGSGPYFGQVEIGSVSGASATNTITVNGNGAVLEFLSTNTNARSTLKLDGASYWTFDNVHFKSLGTTTTEFGWAVHLANNADFNTFTNCTFESNTILTSLNYAGLVASNSNTSATLAGTPASNLTITNSHFIGGYYGLSISGPSAAPFAENCIIENNVFEDFYLYGIYVRGTINSVYSGNDISRATRTTLSSFYGIALFGDVTGTVIDANRIHDNANGGTTTALAYPIYGSAASGSSASPLMISNNAIYNINSNGTTYGIYFIGLSDHHRIYHNTVILDNTAHTGSSTIANYYTTAAHTNIELRNNIFVINNGSSGLHYHIWSSNATATPISNNNVFWNPSAGGTQVTARLGTTNYVTLADWQSHGNSFDLNSVNANPVIAGSATGDVTPLASAVNDIGAPVGITADLLGNPRSATTPDPGAVEFSPIGSDLALVDGSIERASLCYSSNENASFSIFNILGPAIDFSVNPVTLNWALSGPVSSSGSTTINTGSLNSGDTLLVTVSGLDMSAPGMYALSGQILPNAFNLVGSNDEVSGITANVFTLLNVFSNKDSVFTNTELVELRAASMLMPVGGEPFITEICHFKTTTGAPTTGWPAYLIADDYIEVTWSPGADLGGYTLEQWNTSGLAGTYTFPSGTFISPNGTAIIAVGQLGTSVESPSDYYYHGNGTFTSTWGSTTPAGRIIKNPVGTIVDAVVYGNFSFPGASGVTAADWSGVTPAVSSSGNRLEGAYTKDATNWINSGVSPQDPNTLNNGVTPPVAAVVPGLIWTNNGNFVDSTNSSILVGPFTANGTYTYEVLYNSSCGPLSGSVDVVVEFGTLPIVYCASNATSVGDTKIDSVVIGSFSTGTASTICETYTDNTGFGSVATVDMGSSIPVFMKSGYCGGTSYPAHGRVFVDLNHDGDFTANEALLDLGPLSATGSGTLREWMGGNMIIPPTAMPGTTRLRIVYREGAASFAAVTGCGTYSWGETEDYEITITQPNITPVQLLAPFDGAQLRLAGPGETQVTASWTAAATLSGQPANYTFELATSPTGFGMPIFSKQADGNGDSTRVTFTYAELDSLLDLFGVGLGDTANLYWNVRAVAGSDVSNAAVPYMVSLVRGALNTVKIVYAPQQNGGTTGVRAPNGTAAHSFHRAAMIVTAQDFADAGINPGDLIYTLSLTTISGTDIPVKGKYNVWLQPTSDQVFDKSTSWSGILSGMSQVFSDSVILPVGPDPGEMVMNLATPFTYQGGAYYVAYDWVRGSTASTTAAIYKANTALAGGLVSGNSSTLAPETLAATAFRVEMGWGKERLLFDLEILAGYVMRRNIKDNGPETPWVYIRNNGVSQDPSATFTVTVDGGMGSSSNTYQVPAIATDAVQLFSLPGLPTDNLDFQLIDFELSADQNIDNNLDTRFREVTEIYQSYEIGAQQQAATSVGFGASSGILLQRYETSSSRNLQAVWALLGNAVDNIGQTVYGVVMDTAGTILDSTAHWIMGQQDLGQSVRMAFNNPVAIPAGSYFIGIAQPGNATATPYFPAGVILQSPSRPNSLYFSPLGGGVVNPDNFLNSNGFATVFEAEFASNVMPMAWFSASSYIATTGGAQSVVTLFDNSAGNPTNLNWSIQHIDSNISTAHAVNVINGGLNSSVLDISFNVPGFYNVALTATNAMGTDTRTVLSYFYVENDLCVSRASSMGDTKIDSVSFGGVTTGTAPGTCENYSSYLGRSPLLFTAGDPYGSSVLRTTIGMSSNNYVFAGNTSINGWGSSYSDVAVFSANGQVVMDSMGFIGLGCDPLPAGSLAGKIAVLYRGACEFGTKAYNAQQAGALGVIIVNNQPGAPINLGGGTMGMMVTIPVAMVDEITGWSIISGIDNNPLGFNISMGGLLNNFGTISRGMNEPIAIKPGSCSNFHYTARGKVFIDWNGDYNFDASEEAYAFESNTAFNWVNGMISVPAGAEPGLRRMRIVYMETSNPAMVDPCGIYTWGETEDYLVNVSASFPGVIASLPDTSACTGPISIPVMAGNFNNVGAISMSILFDSTAISFMGVSGINPSLSGGQLLSNAANGRLGISWYDVNGATTSSDTLFFLDFDAQGYSDLIWDQTPGSNEFADAAGNVLLALFNDGAYTPQTNCNEIIGSLRYDNNGQTPLTNSTVMLMQQGQVLQTATTDAMGSFSFSGYPNGTYELTASTTKAWGGVNATDALGVARHFTGAAPLFGRRMAVADVNGSNSINSTDALLVARRFTGQISSFNVGDWYFDVLPIQLTGSTLGATLFGLTYGDVNGSYNPSQARVTPQMFVVNKGVVTLGQEELSIPIRMNEAKEVGAISMELSIPEGVQLHRVSTKLQGGNFDYMLEGQTLRISWFSLNEQALAIDQTIFELHVSAMGDEVIGDWAISGLSEMANGWAEAYANSGVRIPSVQGLAGAFDARIYPNPTADISQLNIRVPESGKVTIRVVDALGKTVMLQQGIQAEAGMLNIQLDAAAWGAGRYQATVLYEAAGDLQMKQLKLQVIR